MERFFLDYELLRRPDPEWQFINDIVSQLGFRANGRKIIEKGQTLQVREEIQSYNPLFEGKNSNIAYDNAIFWQQDAYEQRI